MIGGDGVDRAGRPDWLDIQDLSVAFPGPDGMVEAVRGISLSMAAGERLAIVGESGSGKSISMRAVMGLLPHQARVRATRLAFDGIDLLAGHAMRRLRGRRIAMVLQDPKAALDPVMTAGAQIAEGLRLHRGLRGRAARAAALDLLDRVRIDGPARVHDLYPHQMSGGMAQRVMIAMMLAGEPELLIADEPTSALDVSVRGEILALIDGLVRDRSMGLVLISHDLDLVAAFTDRVAVMYGGRIMETLPADGLGHARHPYTRGLIGCRPRLDARVAPLPVLVRDPRWRDGPQATSSEGRGS